MASDMQRIRDAIKPHGLMIVQGKKHQKIVNRHGRAVYSLPLTPSDNRWWKNVLADLRRYGHIR